MNKYVIGIDYGTDSARALIVDALTGKEISTSVMYYPRWKEGKFCWPSKNQYRQHPLDYIEVMEFVITDSIKQAGSIVAKDVVGISFDTTGSTPVFVDQDGTPLAMKPEFTDNPNAMFLLWKDHTAITEADEINELCRKWDVDYTKYVGGIYSSEWVWAKALHVLRQDIEVRNAAYSWIEHCDWMTALLTGKTRPEEVIRSRCAAGHKAMWHTDWKGLPPEEFFVELDPLLKGYRKKLYNDTYTSDVMVGNLTAHWAQKLGLSQEVVVGVGAFDCHMGAVGGGATPNVLARAIGTSTCDILTANYNEVNNKCIRGICGQVDGSVIPGLIGLEAGQSAFGDIYAWFKRVLTWPVEKIISESTLDENTKEKLIEETLKNIIPKLAEEAAAIPKDNSTAIALDWHNGRRTPDANQKVKGALTNITLGTGAAEIFRALVEATAFGSKAIVDRFIEEGVQIKEIIGLGGVAKKSPFVMQTLADVLDMPIKVAKAEQTCALGAAMFAAVAAGVYSKVEDAQKAMGQGFEEIYYPNRENVDYYKKQYAKYQKLGAFAENNL